jgi:hypothetical protein
LFARGHVHLSEVLSELRVEETHLRGAGLLGVSSVLAARASRLGVIGISRHSYIPFIKNNKSRISRGVSYVRVMLRAMERTATPMPCLPPDLLSGPDVAQRSRHPRYGARQHGRAHTLALV